MAQSQLQKAEKMHNNGNNQQAVVALKAILQKNPNHLETLELLGDIASANANWTQALSYYQKLANLYKRMNLPQKAAATMSEFDRI